MNELSHQREKLLTREQFISTLKDIAKDSLTKKQMSMRLAKEEPERFPYNWVWIRTHAQISETYWEYFANRLAEEVIKEASKPTPEHGEGGER